MTHELPAGDLSGDAAESRLKVEPPSVFIRGIAGLIFVAGGLFAVGLWYQDAVPAQRINLAYLPSECTALDKHVERFKVRDYNPGRSGLSHDYENVRESGHSPSVLIRYSIGGTKYEIWTFDGGAGHFTNELEAESEIEGFIQGEPYPCWYDPADPKNAVIRRLSSYRQNYTGVAAAGLFSLMGLGGLLFCGRRTLQAWRN